MSSTFRATRAGAWRGSGSYGDSFYRAATACGAMGPDAERGYVLRAGRRLNVQVVNRQNPHDRLAKVLEDGQWRPIDLSDQEWIDFEPSFRR